MTTLTQPIDDVVDDDDFAPAPCGTWPGWLRHLAECTAPCDPCYDAKLAHDAAEPAKAVPAPRRKPTAFRKPIQHGTAAGASAHRRRDERPCRACLDGEQRKKRERQAGRGKGRTPEGCGTLGGYSGHKHRGEDPCRRCKDARNAYSRDWRAGKTRRAVAA